MVRRFVIICRGEPLKHAEYAIYSPQDRRQPSPVTCDVWRLSHTGHCWHNCLARVSFVVCSVAAVRLLPILLNGLADGIDGLTEWSLWSLYLVVRGLSVMAPRMSIDLRHYDRKVLQRGLERVDRSVDSVWVSCVASDFIWRDLTDIQSASTETSL